MSFRPLSGRLASSFPRRDPAPCGPEKAGRSDPGRGKGQRVSPLSGFQASRAGWAQGTHTSHRVAAWGSASISPQTAFAVPLVPEPWLCQAAPLPDSPSQGPWPVPSHSSRGQTLDGQELSLRNGPSRGFTGLRCYPAMPGARRGCPCLFCPQRWEPAGGAPAPPHTAHQTANSFLKP